MGIRSSGKALFPTRSLSPQRSAPRSSHTRLCEPIFTALLTTAISPSARTASLLINRPWVLPLKPPAGIRAAWNQLWGAELHAVFRHRHGESVGRHRGRPTHEFPHHHHASSRVDAECRKGGARVARRQRVGDLARRAEAAAAVGRPQMTDRGRLERSAAAFGVHQVQCAARIEGELRCVRIARLSLPPAWAHRSSCHHRSKARPRCRLRRRRPSSTPAPPHDRLRPRGPARARAERADRPPPAGAWRSCDHRRRSGRSRVGRRTRSRRRTPAHPVRPRCRGCRCATCRG